MVWLFACYFYGGINPISKDFSREKNPGWGKRPRAKDQAKGKGKGVMKIGVIGAGSWGTALAILLGQKGLPVSLWVRRTGLLEEIAETRINSDYLPDIFIPENIELTNDLEEAVRQKNLIILSVPSHALAALIREIKNFLGRHTIIVNTAKGLAEGSCRRLSQVITAELAPRGQVAVLSGPNHAEEVSRLLPTASVVASTEQAVAEKV